jgi:hypothetical protein
MIITATIPRITIPMVPPGPRPKKPDLRAPGNPPPLPVFSRGSPSGVILFVFPESFLKGFLFIVLITADRKPEYIYQ